MKYSRVEFGTAFANAGVCSMVPRRAKKAAEKAMPVHDPAHSSSEEANNDKRRLFPIVGIGASAGGLEAFTELLRHLPLDTGMAFVLVQHLDPQHESALTSLLSRATSLPVDEV